MLTTVEKLLFTLLVLASLSAGYIAFERMYKIIMRGEGELRLDHLPQRLLKGTVALFTQGDILKNRKITSIFHYGVAWGFIFYGLVNIVDVLEGFVPGFHFLGDTVFAGIYRLLADLFSVTVLVGVIYFIIRRFIARAQPLQIRENVKLHPKARQGGISQDSFIVAFFILFHVGSRFTGQSFLLAHEGRELWQPFASIVSGLWSGWSPAALTVGWHAAWWLALGLILLFIPYFPATKHAHLFMGPLNFMTRPERAALGALDPLDFEDETVEQFGVATLTQLPKTQILDAFACIMCNRCQQACPAYNTGKELSPAAIEVNKRYFLREHMASLADGADDTIPLLDFAISESALWACTTCGACVEACPVGNEPMFDILQMRQDRVMMESSFPDQLKAAFTGMERLQNPWGMTEDRMAWTEPLDFQVPTVEDNPDFDVLYWVGCAGAFDPGGQAIAQAIATVLHSAGVNFAVLGGMETCTGDSARRAGNEYLFFEMAMGNIEVLNEVGADKKTIVTGCPHCLHTLGKEYPALGGHYRVLHHTQMIADLVGKGKLQLNGNRLEKVTFHDPCYLGRHNGIYDAPRDALAQAGLTLLEMNRHKNNSFCCGAGGAQMWKEEEHGTQAVNINRYEEAKGTGAEVLAVGCPFCSIMMKDANQNAGSAMQIKDVAQVVAEAIRA
ncbi:MAG: (Fe-S)-binding protein [Ardenticatenales bacterium]|nr:(Fe-S)-binding protein [Ardenticatenales bacterium]